MRDRNSDSALQPDMHLKPLDNAALLKPLRKPPDLTTAAPSRAVPVSAPPAPQQAPVVRMTTPAAKSFVYAADEEDDEDDLPEEPQQAYTPTAAPLSYAATPFYAPALKDAYSPAAAPLSYAATPAYSPAPKEAYAPPAAPVSYTEPPAHAPAPMEAYTQAVEPLSYAEPPAYAPAPKDSYAPAAAPVSYTEPPSYPKPIGEDYAPPAYVQPAAIAAPTPPVSPKAAVKETPFLEDDEEELAQPAPAIRSDASFRPTDEQMHMMELMKSIFANALNNGVSAGQPPQFAAPAAPPDLDDLRKALVALQQKIREAEIPVVIVIEGLSASGKGTMLSALAEGLDPRGCKLYPIRKPDCVEEAYPALRRYWISMPAKGEISLFCSSWYGELNKACFSRENEIADFLPKRLNEIISMESQLVCDGALILKFFLHISQQEQYDRLKKLEKKKATAWLVDGHDREQNRRYDEYMKGMDDLMSITNLKGAPWHVLDASDLKDCARQMLQTVIRAFEDALQRRLQNLRPWDVPMLPNLSPIPALGFPPLASIDLSKRLNASYDALLDDLKKRLAKLQVRLYRKGIPMIVGFEGWDAAGKGGAIHRLASALDARGYTVAPISAPTPTEASHHYMWRFWNALPPKGQITIFDRTWYGRVMVERVENLCTVPQWQRAYEEINRFEKLLTDDGAILCKFWLQIDPAAQLQRFQERRDDPEKRWKLTDDDWRNREKWPAYEQAVNEVLQRTHTPFAPWTVVEANDKDYARVKVLRTVIAAMEKRLGSNEDEE